MDERTGKIYPSAEAAEDAGVPAEHLVTGPPQALERLAALVREREAVRAAAAEQRARRKKQQARRKAKRQIQKASRWRNRA